MTSASSMEKPVVPRNVDTEKKPTNERTVFQKLKIAMRTAFTGAALLISPFLIGKSEIQSVDTYSKPALTSPSLDEIEKNPQFWFAKPEGGHEQITAQAVIPIDNANVTPAEMFNETGSVTLADIPSGDAEFPALILYSDKFIDTPKPDDSAPERVKIFADDLGGILPDRAILVVSRRSDLQPAVHDTDVKMEKKRVFYPVKAETAKVTIERYFEIFNLSDEVVDAITNGTVTVYWRNFGGARRGDLPEIYLVKQR